MEIRVAADRQERIRHRAYAIWEREGRPDGRAAEHWRIAAQEVEEEERKAGRAAAPAAASKEGGTARPRRAAPRRAPRSPKKG